MFKLSFSGFKIAITAAHEVITGKKDGTTAVAELEKALKKIKGKGW